jgi:hypothetical protein
MFPSRVALRVAMIPVSPSLYRRLLQTCPWHPFQQLFCSVFSCFGTHVAVALLNQMCLSNRPIHKNITISFLEYFCLLGCDAMCSGRRLWTLWRNVLPQSSDYKNVPYFLPRASRRRRDHILKIVPTRAQ